MLLTDATAILPAYRSGEKPLCVTPVTTPEHREQVRQLRNAGAAFLARDPREIGHEENARYWAEHGHAIRAWLYAHDGGLVGCSSLHTRPDGRTWTFLAIDPWCRGQGYGRRIFAHLLAQHDGELWAVVNPENEASLKLHREEDGWAVVGLSYGQVTLHRRARG